jgi:hypothetical protein
MVSSISAKRCEMTDRKDARPANSTAPSISDNVQIWFGFTSTALATLARIPCSMRLTWS